MTINITITIPRWRQGPCPDQPPEAAVAERGPGAGEAHQEQDALHRRGARGLLHQPPGLFNCALASSS